MTNQVKSKPLPASTRTVTVACKVPTGMVLQLQKKQPTLIPDGRGELKEHEFFVKHGPVHFVAGPAYPKFPPKGYPPPPLIVGGYALTPGIPAEFWEEWLEQNKLAQYVLPVNGSEHGAIFAMPTMEDAKAAAEEHEKLLTGLEPISTDVDKNGALIDKRIPRPIGLGIAKLQADSHAG